MEIYNLHTQTQAQERGTANYKTLSPIPNPLSSLYSRHQPNNKPACRCNLKKGRTKLLENLREGLQNSLLRSSRKYTQSQVKRGYKLLLGYQPTDINDWHPTRVMQNTQLITMTIRMSTYV
jgi:hypothetical protein